MNYLKQLHAWRGRQGCARINHINGQHAFRAAMKQLEEGYGDNEVIANAFIKKALDWPNLNPGDPKAFDDFFLFFLNECKKQY